MKKITLGLEKSGQISISEVVSSRGSTVSGQNSSKFYKKQRKIKFTLLYWTIPKRTDFRFSLRPRCEENANFLAPQSKCDQINYVEKLVIDHSN